MDFAWIRKDGRLTYIDPNIERITGWSAEEMLTQPLKSFVTTSTSRYIKANYYTGPPDSIVPRSFRVDLIHRDGHEVCCRAVAVCRYDADGDLAEAWGCLRREQDQRLQNEMLDWWSKARERELEIMAHLLEMCAA